MSNQYPEQLNNPTVESNLRQWHEFDGLHRLVGSMCEKCGKKFFPKRSVCANCHSLNMMDYKFSGNGILENFDFQSLPAIKLMGFREQLTRVMIIVKLSEGPSVVSELVDFKDIKKVRVGMHVHSVLRKISRSGNGDYKYAYKFVCSRF